MSTPLKTYRIYCFDAARKVVSGDWLNAADDNDAIARAHAQGFGSKCEIWDGKRLVAQLEEQRLQA
jgi:hypothetical protein